jgi:hypothetical protein
MSYTTASFAVGDRVLVLNAFRLPAIEEVRHVGIVQRIDVRGPSLPDLYWVSGLAVARTAHVLRRDDAHLRVSGAPRTLAERYAAEDEENQAEERYE